MRCDGIFFGGGASQCLMQINTVKAMELACNVSSVVPHLSINAVGARSAGCFVALAVAMGIDSQTFIERMSHIKRNLFSPDVRNLAKPGVWAMDSGILLREFVNTYLEHVLRLENYACATIADIERVHGVRVFIQAVDVCSQESIVMPSRAMVLDCIMAACAIPIVFAPVPFEGKLLIDAGFTSRGHIIKVMRSLCENVCSVGYAPSGAAVERPTSAMAFYTMLLAVLVASDSKARVDGEVHVTTRWVSMKSALSHNPEYYGPIVQKHWEDNRDALTSRFSVVEAGLMVTEN